MDMIQAVRSVVDINHSSSSAAGLCENQPDLTAIFSIAILSKPQGVGTRCACLCFWFCRRCSPEVALSTWITISYV
jgi:hypothetical protein